MSVRLHEPVCFDNMQNQFYWIDHFLGDQLKDEWRVAGTGTGVVVDQQAGGIVRVATGAVATNTIDLDWADFRILLASKRVAMETRVKLNQLTSYRVNYQLFFGWNDYIDFRASSADADWFIRTMNGGASTSIDSNIIATTNYAIFRIECHLDGGAHVHFYIDPPTEGNGSPINTNIPTNHLQLQYEVYTGENVSKSIDVDYVVVRQDI